MPETLAEEIFVNFVCSFDEETVESHWVMQYNGSIYSELPECLYFCPKSPIPINASHLLNTWNGQHWSDTYPIFSCDAGTLTKQ